MISKKNDTENQIIIITIIRIMMIRQLIRRSNITMKSLQGRHTPGSRDECRTADPLTKPTDFSHWPAFTQL